jgi:hypothetical protein
MRLNKRYYLDCCRPAHSCTTDDPSAEKRRFSFRGQVSLCENAKAASGALLILAEVGSMRERKTETDSANCYFLGLFMCPEGLSDRFSTRLKQVGGMR